MKISRNWNPNSLKRNRGFGVLEILVAIAIVGFLVFVMLGWYNRAQASSMSTTEAQNFNLMLADTRAKFAPQGSFVGITPGVLVNLGIARGTSVAGETITTGWNTTVAVAAVNLFGNAADGVEFTYTVPRTACADFVTNGAGGVARVTVGGTVVKDTTVGSNNVNVATLSSSCEGGTGGNVTVAMAQGR